jgi:hypothetical protein
LLITCRLLQIESVNLSPTSRTVANVSCANDLDNVRVAMSAGTNPPDTVGAFELSYLHMCPLGCSPALKDGRSDVPLQPLQIR